MAFIRIAARKCKTIKAMASPTVSAPKREKDPKKRVVITGMGLVSVFGSDIDTFYNKLLEGESGISLIDRYSLVAGKRALEDVNLGYEVLNKGSAIGGLTNLTTNIQNHVQKGVKKVSPLAIPYTITNMGGALLAIETGLMGPNYSISTACSTANYCFCAASNHIRRGEVDIMVVGGTEASIIPMGVGGLIACRALSQRNEEPKKASRPWDKHRDGYVIDKIMESLESAVKRGARILAEYLGGAITCDAHHMTNPMPDGLGQSSCISKSLQDAGVSPQEVNYVNAHATSSLIGDLAEVNAIKQVFKDTSELKMNGTKSIIGHCIGAAGALEAITTIKAITTGWLHPTINQDNLEDDVTIDTVPNVKKKHEVNVAISNSFGFGGHNSVVVFAPFMP
ncbi:3-oxoacyl-[acyl-carrier] synthase I [Medicago truncatula]|uniref:beta-ketoacyl-[acyl-carrier-protein] synthase I n=1 Tax=Medicago truncatula TaxID=3880 RepID=A0A072TWK1_MEDTR|nr:3-oxoacyl-[acyl-carrier] synthase I [Medicago truncatula]